MASVEIKLNSPYHCCVPLRKGDSRQDFSLSFYRFPKDLNVRKYLIVTIRRYEGQGQGQGTPLKVEKYEQKGNQGKFGQNYNF